MLLVSNFKILEIKKRSSINRNRTLSVFTFSLSAQTFELPLHVLFLSNLNSQSYSRTSKPRYVILYSSLSISLFKSALPDCKLKFLGNFHVIWVRIDVLGSFYVIRSGKHVGLSFTHIHCCFTIILCFQSFWAIYGITYRKNFTFSP